ncbi:MAG: hypothetical protein QF619_02325 [Candidatus Binatia bacterium]|nr:hypothetical protein [Candidatus Binatia bacterium]
MVTNFYDDWLGSVKRSAAERAAAPVHSRGHDPSRISTPQDTRVAMLAGPQVSFRTMGGGCVLIGEIPSGWETGQHTHGKESIYILEGEGYSLIGGKKYSWETGDCLQIYSEAPCSPRFSTSHFGGRTGGCPLEASANDPAHFDFRSGDRERRWGQG